jgi:putative ABC transport system substrate-binding protein
LHPLTEPIGYSAIGLGCGGLQLDQLKRRECGAKCTVPVISAYRQFVLEGSLISYGPDPSDIFRRTGSYVDRILRGEKPADLPVQSPTKFELVVNMITAKALGLTVRDSFLLLADEVIE